MGFDFSKLKKVTHNDIQNNIVNVFKTFEPGTIVVYSKSTKQFLFFHYNAICDLIIDDHIMIGVVLYQNHKTKSIYMLLKGFLMKEPLRIPFSYCIKKKFIPAFVRQQFNLYAAAFKKNSPSIKKIKKLKIEIIDTYLLYTLLTDQNVRKGYEKLVGEAAAENFFNKLYESYIYVQYYNLIYQWHYDEHKNKDEVDEADIFGANFLTVASLNI